MERLAIGECFDRIALGMGEREALVFLTKPSAGGIATRTPA